MTIELPEDLAARIERKVGNGGFATPVEVVRDALERLDEDDLSGMSLDEIRREVAIGVEQLDRGEYTDYPNGAAVAQDMRARGRARLAERNKVKS